MKWFAMDGMGRESVSKNKFGSFIVDRTSGFCIGRFVLHSVSFGSDGLEHSVHGAMFNVPDARGNDRQFVANAHSSL